MFRLFACLALLVTAASCGDADDTTDGGPAVTEPTDQTEPADVPSLDGVLDLRGEGTAQRHQAGVVLEAEATVDGDVMRVSYTVTNGGDDTVAVAAAIEPFREGSTTFRADPTAAWVLAGADGVTRIHKGSVGRPSGPDGEGADPAAAPPVYVVAVDAGTSVHGTVEVPWPLQGHHPWYGSEHPDRPVPDGVEAVAFSVDVAPMTAAIEAAPTVERDAATWYEVSMDGFGNALQTEPVELG